MKAGHRKELQTNILADKLGQLYTKARSSTGLILWVVGVVVVLGVAFWWWSNRALSANSRAWDEYWTNRESLTGLESIAERLKGTSAERAARLTEADRLFNDAYNTFFRSPAEARERFGQALKLYSELSDNPGNSSDLAVRGLLGAAKCHEWTGDLDQARAAYQQIVEKYDAHPLATNARERLAMLDQGESEAVAFYKRWPGRLPDVVSAKPKPSPLLPPDPTPIKPE